MKTTTTTKTAENQQVAVAFYRVSTDKQNNERQYQDVRQYCKAYNYHIAKEFEEIISGASKLSDRKELRAMLAFVEEHKPNFVVCSELSRLARADNALTIIKDWTAKGICFITLKEGIKTLDKDGKTNPMTDMLLKILNAVNIFELETIKYRVKSGLNKTVSSGTWSGGAVPYGYNIVDKRLVVNNNEVEIVKSIFNQYVEGWGTLRIASNLNRQGLTTSKGVMWRDTKVYKILSNSLYVGKRMWNKEVYLQPELRIVDDTVFASVQQRLSNKSNVTELSKQKKYDYLLVGKVLCSCGKHFIGQGRHNIYMCKSQKYGAGCGVKPVKLNWLEEEVKKQLFYKHIALIRNSEKIVDRTAALEAEKAEIEQKIAAEKKHQNYLINNMVKIGQHKFEEKFDASTDYIKQLETRLDEVNIGLNDVNKFNLKAVQYFNTTNKDSRYHKYYDQTPTIEIDKELVQAAIQLINVDNDSIKVNLVNGNSFELPRTITKRGRQPKEA